MNLYAHAVLRTVDGKFLLQSRGWNPGIHAPGVVSLFGGGAEGAETPEACVIREILEELELHVQKQDLEFLWEGQGLSPDGVTPARRVTYLVRNVDPSTCVLHEGEALVLCDFEEMLTHPMISDRLKNRFAQHRHQLLA